MPRREPPRHLRAVCPATCCAATAKPNELCSRSPSRRVVLLQVSSRWRPVDSLVPVYPATPLRGHKTTVRRDWHPDPLADLPTAAARRRGAPVTPAKHHFATEPLLLVHWKSALIPEWNRHRTLASQTLPIATTLRSSARILSGAFSPFRHPTLPTLKVARPAGLGNLSNSRKRCKKFIVSSSLLSHRCSRFSKSSDLR